MRRVAVTGFGVVSPIGIGREAFFQALMEGRNGIECIKRFDASKLMVNYAAEVKDMPAFAFEHEMQLNERDPKVGFALLAAAEALKMANITAFTANDLIHIGTSLETFFFKEFAINSQALQNEDFYRQLVINRWRLPLDAAIRAIERRYGRAGHSVTNCSACAVGSQTIGQAFRAIRNGRYDLALAGGFDSMINPLGVGGFQLLGAPAMGKQPIGKSLCRPFDAARSGLVLGEGAGFVVLEDYDRALNAGKTIYAEILGYGATLDAYGLSAPEPSGDGAAHAMMNALADAELYPDDIDNINAHGTGTLLNDPMEATAIRRVFADTWQKVPVTAIKSMLGHSIAAAGSIELIASIYTLLNNIIPPNIGLDTVSKDCELMHVQHRALPCEVNTILSNSFGFGGQNTAIIIKKAII